jgi:uncharacterized membrane protein YgdD (TMEM256/DUF423 family)
MEGIIMNRLLLCGAALGLVSVIMGALGDHAFDLTPEKAESLATAIRYNMLYSVLIVVLALARGDKKLHICGYIFALGTALFSFSIYTSLATGVEQLTYMTPVGGITIMAGWVTVIISSLKKY